MNVLLITALAAAALSVSTAPARAQYAADTERFDVRIEVPQRAAPALDGALRTEWDAAAVVRLPDDGELRLLHDGSALYLALLTNDERIGSICVARGDEVRVLHASMALGDVVYRRSDGDVWERGADFAWGVRDIDLTELAVTRREQWYADHGWAATTAPMSRPLHVLEYRIALRAGERPRLALAHLAMSGEGVVVHAPAGATGCADRDLVRGAAPAAARFAPAEWYELWPVSRAGVPRP